MTISSLKAVLLIALCVYHEGRGEPIPGQKAIVHVILNRVQERGQSVEDVIYQKYQFSWTGDNIPDYPMNLPAYIQCLESTLQAVDERLEGKNFWHADHYFNPSVVSPVWADKMKVIEKIGKHLFLRS